MPFLLWEHYSNVKQYKNHSHVNITIKNGNFKFVNVHFNKVHNVQFRNKTTIIKACVTLQPVYETILQLYLLESNLLAKRVTSYKQDPGVSECPIPITKKPFFRWATRISSPFFPRSVSLSSHCRKHMNISLPNFIFTSDEYCPESA